MKLIIRLLRNESGATAIEYGLIVMLVALVLIAALNAVGNSVRKSINDTAGAFNSNGNGCNPNCS